MLRAAHRPCEEIAATQQGVPALGERNGFAPWTAFQFFDKGSYRTSRHGVLGLSPLSPGTRLRFSAAAAPVRQSCLTWAITGTELSEGVEWNWQWENYKSKLRWGLQAPRRLTLPVRGQDCIQRHLRMESRAGLVCWPPPSDLPPPMQPSPGRENSIALNFRRTVYSWWPFGSLVISVRRRSRHMWPKGSQQSVQDLSLGER